MISGIRRWLHHISGYSKRGIPGIFSDPEDNPSGYSGLLHQAA
jgi:hypothetical protein